MGWDTEARHVNADYADTIDCIGQQPQRHTARGRHAQVGHHDSVIFFRISHQLDGFLNVFKQLPSNERLGTEWHIANAAAGPIEMAGECQAVNTAGRTREDRRRAPHPQANAQ